MQKYGCLSLKIHGHAMQASGWPDALIIHPKFFCFIEFKAENGKLTPLQERILNIIAQRNVLCYTLIFSTPMLLTSFNTHIIRTIDNAKELVDVLTRDQELQRLSDEWQSYDNWD